jgi:DNA-directed RNA polymerase specialized sigma24 family protein
MQSWSGHHTIDPSEMETRFCEEDGISYMDSIFSEPSDDDLAQIDRIRSVVESLPPREADFVELYYFRRLRQTDIAAIFGVSQPTVCYRLARAADRIRFLLNLPQVEKGKMERDLAGALSDPLDVQILMLMWETTCQSEVAKRLSVSQGLVRHRFLRSLSRIRDNARLAQYTALFDYIAANLNILREVQRPAWNDRMVHCIC